MAPPAPQASSPGPHESLAPGVAQQLAVAAGPRNLLHSQPPAQISCWQAPHPPPPGQLRRSTRRDPNRHSSGLQGCKAVTRWGIYTNTSTTQAGNGERSVPCPAGTTRGCLCQGGGYLPASTGPGWEGESEATAASRSLGSHM